MTKQYLELLALEYLETRAVPVPYLGKLARLCQNQTQTQTQTQTASEFELPNQSVPFCPCTFATPSGMPCERLRPGTPTLTRSLLVGIYLLALGLDSANEVDSREDRRTWSKNIQDLKLLVRHTLTFTQLGE